jgi:hypothetical protein
MPGAPVDRPNLNTRDAMRRNVRFLTKHDFKSSLTDVNKLRKQELSLATTHALVSRQRKAKHILPTMKQDGKGRLVIRYGTEVA